jgi:hypothetical protein
MTKALRYQTAEDMQKVIDEYFKSCEGKPLLDDEGLPILNKYSQPIILRHKPPTVTGLALALGFNSRQSLLNYAGRENFVDTITRAKSTIEEYAESRLYDKDGVNGAKFNLINNFKGWKEKQEVESHNTNYNIELTKEQAEYIMTETDPIKIEEFYKNINTTGK